MDRRRQQAALLALDYLVALAGSLLQTWTVQHGDAAAGVSDQKRDIRSGGDPHTWSVHLYLAAVQAHLGNLERPRSSLQVVNRMSPGHTIARLRSYRTWSNPEYRRLAEDTYYAGLREAGMPER